MIKVRVRPETGRIYFDGFFHGKRFKELTLLEHSAENERAAQSLADKMNLEIKKRTFEFRRFFPTSKRATMFDSADAQLALSPPGSLSPASVIKSPEAGQRFDEFSRQFFAEQGVGWRANTREWMDSILRTHLLPVFATRPINTIRREDILAFRLTLSEKRNGKGRGLSPKTINVVMRVMKAIMAEGSARYAYTNPVAGIKRLKVPRKEIVPFSLNEVQLIIDTVRKDYRVFLLVAFFTGMRPAEQIGLKWENVDFARREIRVRETLSKGRTEYTKTDGSQREIAISGPVFDALTAQFLITGKRSDYVFCLRDGQAIGAKNFSDRVWHPLLRHLQLKRRTPYQTRHTCATLWLGAGENPEWIAKQLGHTTTEMLFRVYSRFIPNLTRQDGSAFERVLAQAGVAASKQGKEARDVT